MFFRDFGGDQNDEIQLGFFEFCLGERKRTRNTDYEHKYLWGALYMSQPPVDLSYTTTMLV